MILPELKVAVFVHGCFWHGHRCRRGRRLPATRREYWLPKLARNKERDRRARRRLRAAGWRVVTVWECWTREAEGLRERLAGRKQPDAKLECNSEYRSRQPTC